MFNAIKIALVVTAMVMEIRYFIVNLDVCLSMLDMSEKLVYFIQVMVNHNFFIVVQNGFCN